MFFANITDYLYVTLGVFAAAQKMALISSASNPHADAAAEVN